MRPIAKAGLLIGTIGAGVTLSAVQSLRAQEEPSIPSQTITECKNLLPENKQYTMNIDFYIDTHDGAKSTLDIVLLDDAVPESLDIPEGSRDFLDCIIQSLGIPDA